MPERDGDAGSSRDDERATGSPSAAEGAGQTDHADSAGADHAERAPEEQGTPEAVAGKPARAGRGRTIRLLAGVMISAALLGYAVHLAALPRHAGEDFDGPGSGVVTVRIPAGATAAEIGRKLADAGVVASAGAFAQVAQARGKAGSLRPGYFLLRRGMAAEAALDLLLSPESRVFTKVTVPEGLRLDEVFALAAKVTGFPLAAFQRAEVAAPYGKGLEGLLFPATYEVEPDQTAADLLRAMVARFEVAAAQLDLVAGAARLGLQPLQLVTVASLAQAEGGTEADYPKIARVIYNRLRAGMPLQLDTTVLYAQRRHTLRVSERDTRVRSPYNTYLRPGLPPGPISNPGEQALAAAMRPAQGSWLWFVTTDPEHRITKFTDKESEFVRYRKELNGKLGLD